MHVIKSIANSICKQIFDNGHCLTNLIVAEETIELRGFLSGDLFFLLLLKLYQTLKCICFSIELFKIRVIQKCDLSHQMVILIKSHHNFGLNAIQSNIE